MSIIQAGCWTRTYPAPPLELLRPVAKKVLVHDREYDNAWIMAVDRGKGVVIVQTVTKKTTIEFKVPKGEIRDFPLSHLAPVTFECAAGLNDKCDLKKKFKLYISARYVELVSIQF